MRGRIRRIVNGCAAQQPVARQIAFLWSVIRAESSASRNPNNAMMDSQKRPSFVASLSAAGYGER